MMQNTIREQRLTHIPIGDEIIEVSSVHYSIGTVQPVTLNETCVFFPNGHSEVRGTYDEHDDIVEELRHS